MSSLCLVGPPEIKNPKLSPSLATAQSANTGNPFLDLLNTSFNSIDKPLHPPKTQTENSSPTYYSTGKPCLDFFYHVVPDTPEGTLTDLLQKAYDHSPITAVKLICNLRGNRGAGKSDKEGFYKAALWLHKYHPKTLACNVGVIARFGYFKDLPEILYRILLNSNVRDVARAAHSQNKMLKQQKIKRASEGYGDLKGKMARPFDRKKWSSNGGSSKKKIGESDDAKAASREARVMASRKRDAIEKKEAKRIREEKRISMAKKAITSYAKDPDQCYTIRESPYGTANRFVRLGSRVSVAPIHCNSLFLTTRFIRRLFEELKRDLIELDELSSIIEVWAPILDQSTVKV